MVRWRRTQVCSEGDYRVDCLPQAEFSLDKAIRRVANIALPGMDTRLTHEERGQVISSVRRASLRPAPGGGEH